MKVRQEDFRSALFDPGVACPKGLTDGQGRPAGRRFDVYRNNVATALGEALETAFPVVAKLVGEANFRVLAAAFLRAHPPRSPLMMYYGAEMPDFLAAFGPTAKIGYLPDVARLEIKLRESYHAADATPVPAEALQALSPAQLMSARVRLAPSLRLLRSPWPVHAIWRFNTENDAPKPQMQAQDIAILRPGFDPVPHLLPAGAGDFMEALILGVPFGAAIEAAPAGFDLAATFGLLIGGGAVTQIEE